jgi:hypothetical protein
MKKAKKVNVLKKSKGKNKTRSKLKSASKSVSKSVKSMTKILKIEAIDQKLLQMASSKYNKILSQIESGKKRINDERRIALQIGSRILSKAKQVRDSLMTSPKTRR